jgi:predicted dehydrogenase
MSMENGNLNESPRGNASQSTRRGFMKNAALGAAGLALAGSASSFAAVVGANDTVRVAVAGLKRRGRPILQALSKLPKVKVTCICEVDQLQLQVGLGHCDKYLGYRPATEKDLRKVVERSDVDAIFLTLPDHWHAYATTIALQNGKHVYLEKPCSHNLAEDELLMRAERQYQNLKVQVGTQQRSSVESREIIAEIHRGAIGEAYKAVAFYNNDRNRVANPREVVPPSTLDWELWQGPAPRRPFLDILEDYDWHWRWHWGTGEVANNGNHELDVARWALGVHFPQQVQTQSGKFHFVDDGWEMYDTMEASYRFAGNKVIQWDGKSRNGYSTYGAGRGTIIYGTEGSVFLNRDGYRLYDRAGKLVRERTGEAEDGVALGGGGSMTEQHVRNFVDAIRGDASLNAPVSEGGPSSHLTHYANVSSRAGDALLRLDAATGRFEDQELERAFWGRDYEAGWEISL